jgi:probable rRNA maturation factor
MTVRVALPEAGPDASLPACDPDLLRERAERALVWLGEKDAELSVALVDDAAMTALNERYRDRRGPTDVLSFSLLEGPASEHRGGCLGDVVIDLEVAARQARELGHGLDDELLRLLVHGVLHLLGHDHEEPEEAREMEALEGRLWDAIV